MSTYTKKHFLSKIFYFFRPFWKYFLITIFILTIAQVIATLSPYLFGKGVDAVIKGDVKLTFIFIGVSFLIAVFSGQVLWFLKEYIDVKYLDINIEKTLSVNSIEKMFGFSIGQHINEHSGVKQTIVNKGQNSLMSLVDNFVYDILQISIQILVTLGILAFFDWKVAGIAVVFVLLYILVSNRRNKYFFPKIDEMRKKNQAQSKIQNELFRNSTLVIAEAQEDKTKEDFNQSYNKVTKFTINLWMIYLKKFYRDKFLIIAGRYATLSFGIYLILTGHHSTGMFVTFFSWTSSIFDNLTMLMNSQRRLLFQIVEIKKYFELLDIVPDVDLNKGGIRLDPLQGSIEFKNVSFAYPYRKSAQEEEEENSEERKQDHTIKDINFYIPAGAKVGFVGVSGSGKSTLVNLMRRYYEPTKGDILIDGVSLKKIDLQWFRSQIGNVEQKIELFDRSIRDNIVFGLSKDIEVSDEKLNKAIEDSSLGDFLIKLKDHGLDTLIGEGGVKVSGGERQRIGIARALIKDPKILIFDEATSALDSVNEKLIHEAINKGAQGRTTIIIAHRLSTVMDADIIFVISNGVVVGQGTHRELEKNNKEYQKLIKNQILVG